MVAFSRRILLMLGLAFVTVAATPGWANSHPDFSGVWVLDSDASDSLNDVLEAQGRSWPERKLADQVSPTQTVTQTPDTMIIIIDAVVSSKKEVLKLDGSWMESDGGRAGPMTYRTFWSEDGKSLVSESKMTFPNGDPGMMFSTRSLSEDGKTTFILLELKKEDGTYAKSQRVLRKKPKK